MTGIRAQREEAGAGVEGGGQGLIIAEVVVEIEAGKGIPMEDLIFVLVQSNSYYCFDFSLSRRHVYLQVLQR